MALQAMLLQADLPGGAGCGKIHLLPAWPVRWDVEFKLHAPRQTVIEGTVRGGKLTAWTVGPESRRKDVSVLQPSDVSTG